MRERQRERERREWWGYQQGNLPVKPEPKSVSQLKVLFDAWLVTLFFMALLVCVGAIVLMAMRSVILTGTRLPSGAPPIQEPVSGQTLCDYFSSPTATAAGDGSFDTPWTIDTALVKSTLTGGDTVCFRGGTYGVAKLYPTQTINGTDAETPLVYRGYPGELPKFVFQDWYGDSAGQGIQYLVIEGDYVYWQGWEMYYPDWSTNGSEAPGDSTQRWSDETGTNATDMVASGGLLLRGHGSKAIYNILHDTRGDLGGWPQPQVQDSVEQYGNIIYNLGWLAPDRGHGHGAYISSDTVLAGTDSLRLFRKNLVFANLGNGIQVFNSNAFDLANIKVDSNVLWSNGIRNDDDSTSNSSACITVSGGRKTADVLIRGNICMLPVNGVTFSHAGYIGKVSLWKGAGDTNRVELQHNYLGGGELVLLDMGPGTIVNRNTLTGYRRRIDIDTVGAAGFANWATWTWDSTIYFHDVPGLGAADSIVTLESPVRRWGITEWRDTTGFDTDATYTASLATDTNIVVYPADEHEDGRGYIMVFNWQSADSITIDSTSLDIILDDNDTYDIRHAHDLTTSVASGTWTEGGIRLQTSNSNPHYPDMLGGNPYNNTLLNTAPHFNVFIIRKAWEN